MYLYDIQQAAALVVEFTAGKQLEDYQSDVLLRSAVERQLTIIGESLAHLAKVDPQIVARISEHRRIIGFRNVLTHVYFDTDHAIVWGILQDKLSVLRKEVDSLLGEG